MDQINDVFALDPKTAVQEKYAPCASTLLYPGIVPPHFHDAIEIIFTTSGTSTAICNGMRYTLRPGSIFVSTSNEIHYYLDRTEDTCGLVICIEPQLLCGSAVLFRDSIPLSHVWEDPAQEHPLWELVDFMSRHICTNEPDMPCDTQAALTNTILSYLADCAQMEKALLPSTTVTQILRYCQDHFAEPISLELLSGMFHLSVSHISRIFTKKLKISFSEYMNSLRLNRAVELLNTSNITITKAATYAGFPTSQTFNRVFMEKFNMTPSQYRNLQKKKGDASK